MNTDMSTETKKQLLARLRRRYVTAGAEHKIKLLDQAVELLGYHRKAAIRALRAPVKPEVAAPALLLGRPKTYSPAALLPVLKPIWLAAFQPCGRRLHALLPEWVPAYEADHRRLDGDLRQTLLAASARTLDRLIAPLRTGLSRRGRTRPGSLLRRSIPIRGDWTEEGRAGWNWTRWPCAADGSTTCTCGCSTGWTSTPPGQSSGRWKIAASIAL